MTSVIPKTAIKQIMFKNTGQIYLGDQEYSERVQIWLLGKKKACMGNYIVAMKNSCNVVTHGEFPGSIYMAENETKEEVHLYHTLL